MLIYALHFACQLAVCFIDVFTIIDITMLLIICLRTLSYLITAVYFQITYLVTITIGLRKLSLLNASHELTFTRFISNKNHISWSVDRTQNNETHHATT